MKRLAPWALDHTSSATLLINGRWRGALLGALIALATAHLAGCNSLRTGIGLSDRPGAALAVNGQPAGDRTEPENPRTGAKSDQPRTGAKSDQPRTGAEPDQPRTGAKPDDPGAQPGAARDGAGPGESAPATVPPSPTQWHPEPGAIYRPDFLPNLSLTPPMLFELLAADVAVQRGQLATAYSTYSGLAAQTRDPRLARRATEIALNGRAFDQALTAARLWGELDSKSDEPKQAIETLLLATDRLTEAEPLLKQRLASARTAGQIDLVYAQLQRTLTRIEDRQGAWSMMRRLSASDLDRLSARRARAIVAEAAGDGEAAATEALAAQQLAPKDVGLVIQAARLTQELANDGPARAAQLLNDFIRQNPSEPLARLALGRSYLSAGQIKPARATLGAALKHTPDDPATLFMAAQAAYQDNDLDAAQVFLEELVALPGAVARDNAPALIFLGQIAEDKNLPSEAITYLEGIESGELYLAALARRATLMARGGNFEGASKLLETAPARDPQERAALISARAGILRESQRHQEAFEVLSKGLAEAPDNPDLLYDHAMAAEKVERLDALEQSLRRLIELRPENAHAYNALGYTFADRNKRLPEALALIRKALTLAPNDAQIIDSLGWVQFRLGNVDEALVHLRRAYEMKPDVEVAAHLGEVLWQSGARDEALKVWREASGREPRNAVLLGTLARLNISL